MCSFGFFYVQICGTVYLPLLSNCYVLKYVTSQLSVHADKSVPFLLFAGCFSSQFYHNGGGGWHSAMSSVASPIQFRESVFLFQFRSSNQFRYFQMVCSFFFSGAWTLSALILPVPLLLVLSVQI